MKNGTLVKLTAETIECLAAIDVVFSENLFRVVDSRRGSVKVAPVSMRGNAPRAIVALGELAGERIECDVDLSRAVEVFTDEVVAA